MLKEVRLKNWKSFKEATLYIDPLTILIGNNASGKSNTLDALLFLQRVSHGIGLFQAINGDVNLPPLRGGGEWVCRKGGRPKNRFTLTAVVEGKSSQQDIRYEITVQVHRTKAEIHEEKLTTVNHRIRSAAQEKSLFYTGEIETGKPGIPAYFSTGTQGRGERLDLNRTVTILSQVEAVKPKKEILEAARTLLAQLRGIFVFDPIPNHMRNYSPLSEKLQSDGGNIAGVLAGLSEERRTKTEKALVKYLEAFPEKDIKGISVEFVGKFKTDAMLYCTENWGSGKTHEVDARGMSDGTLRYLSIVAAMLTHEENSLLVIEEVDSGLHPSRLHRLIEMLKELGKERKIDVIVTIHNPALLDVVSADMIPFIAVAHRDPKSGFSKLTQLEDIQNLPKLMAGASLGRLATEGRIESVL